MLRNMFPIRGIRFSTRLSFMNQLPAHCFAVHHTTQIRSISKDQGYMPHNVEDLFPRLCGPSVKKLLAEYGIKFSNVPNSGPRGNILKGDVLTYIHDKKLSLTPATTKKHTGSVKNIIKKGRVHDDLSMSSSRKTTAQQSVLSKTTIPHAYMNVECSIDKVFEYQKRMKQDGFDVSLNDFLVKSAASALRKVPQMNIMKHADQIKPLQHINVVVTDADNTSTVVRKADSLTVQLISEQMKSSSEVESKDVVSLRIFSLGSSGVSEFKAVINPPEVAVLAVGSVRSVYVERNFAQRVRMTLSFNNEVISDEVAASFIHCFKEHVENPLSVCLA